MFNIGPAELIVILLVALLIVGPKRLPEVGKSVGKALREIRRQTDEVRSTFDMNLDDDDEGEQVRDVTGDATTDDHAGEDQGWDASTWESQEERPALPEEATPAVGGEEPADAPESEGTHEPAVAEAVPSRRRRRSKAPGPADDGPGATDPS
jgi:Tat protein translocase TatB subunit